jgi:hypothetical protein
MKRVPEELDLSYLGEALQFAGELIVRHQYRVAYLLPAMYGRHKKYAGAIGALNLLLGWTLIGWFIALVWALKSPPPHGWHYPGGQ